MFWHRSLVPLAALLWAACNPFASEAGHERGTSPAPAASAARRADVTAGAMCKEHGVLEAICTKCNPKLIPVFQARGDWCPEHGFPESVCPICNPQAGGRPRVSIAKDGAPADGLKLRFKRADTARLAGIESAEVTAKALAAAVTAPVRLSYDATKLAHVNARAPGVVRELKVDIGAKVKKGQALVVIDSPNVGADRARLGAAKTRVSIAEENLARQKKLVEEGVATRQSLLTAEQEVQAARAEYSALAASLAVLGAGGGAGGGYTLLAPLAGVVTERRVTIGKLVNSEEVLLEIVDTTTMWADVEVAEQDLPKLTAGQRVTLTFQGLGDRELTGTVDYVAPALDPHTRTAKARVPLDNRDGLLRANLFGQARIALSDAQTSVFAPRAAIQRAGETSFVFVRSNDLEYEVRRVRLGTGDEREVEIKSGLRPGEQVVTTGSFLLKTETSKENIGAGCCEP